MARRGERRRLNRALIDAVLMDDREGVRRLLQQGASVEAWDPEHRDTPLMSAQSDAMRRLLLDRGAEVNARNRDGRTAFSLHPCAILLEAGADINTQDNEGDTPLLNAVFREDLPMVEWLIAKGADVTLKNRGDETALFLARDLDFLPAIEILERAESTGCGNETRA